MEEIWKTIVKNGENTQYQISNIGRVKSLKYGKEKIMRLEFGRVGYYKIRIWHNNKRYFDYVHRLVAEYFLPNFNNKMQINHIDHNKKNNKICNLELVTNKENMQKYKEYFNINKIKKASKLSDKKVLEIRNLYAEGKNKTEVAKLLNVSPQVVIHLLSGRTYKSVK